jgi:hypothetical protein
MLATLLELLGVAGGEAWTKPGADEKDDAGRRQELPSTIDEEEFQMLMLQVGVMFGSDKFCNLVF